MVVNFVSDDSTQRLGFSAIYSRVYGMVKVTEGTKKLGARLRVRGVESKASLSVWGRAKPA